MLTDTDRLEDQVAVLAPKILLVEELRILWIELQENMHVAIWFVLSGFDGAGNGDTIPYDAKPVLRF